MKKIQLILLIGIQLLFIQFSFGQAPGIAWQVNLGGSDFEIGQAAVETADSNYVVVGYTESTNGDVLGNHGKSDVWAVKFQPNGAIEWKKCLGGNESEQASSVRNTLDGNIIICGYASSSNGDVAGIHAMSDAWVLKLDQAGNLLAQKCLGGTMDDRGSYMEQTTDGGYIMSGLTTSNNYDVSGLKGVSDMWIVRMDSSFNILWQRCIGGSSDDAGNWVHECADGGFVAVGYVGSTDGDAVGNHGNRDGIIVKLDASGNIEWLKCLGGSQEDVLYSVVCLDDGGFAALGKTLSKDGDVQDHHGGSGRDYFLARLDASGNLLWENCLGGTKDECAYDIEKTKEGGFILIGHAYSNDGDVTGNHNTSRPDFWVVNTDSLGNILWEQCYGGSEGPNQTGDNPYAIIETSDGGFLMTGRSESAGGDITYNHGVEDMWVVKLQGSGIIQPGITTNGITPLSYTQGDPITVPFTAVGNFNEGNLFTAQLSDAAGTFSQPVDLGTLNSTSSGFINGTIPSATPSGSSYRVRVISSNPAVIGTDNGQNISIQSSCTAPTGLSVSNITGTSAQLNWNAVGNAVSYTLKYKKSGNNPWINLSSSNTNYSLGGLLAQTSYTWQVKTTCQLNPKITSNWSAQNKFNTLTARLGESADAEPRVFPNPAKNSFTLSFYLEQREPVVIELYNVVNQRVAVIASETMDEGLHQSQFQFAALPSGVYFLILKMDEQTRTMRLVVD